MLEQPVNGTFSEPKTGATIDQISSDIRPSMMSASGVASDVGLALVGAGNTLGIGGRWAQTKLVRRHAWLT
jgi:hypothetical protein